MNRLMFAACIVASAYGSPAFAQQQKELAPQPRIAPTAADVHYGKHERQVLDFWQAKSDKPTPLVLYIHGGGWQNGDKRGFKAEPYLDAGISVAAINYRLIKQAGARKIVPGGPGKRGGNRKGYQSEPEEPNTEPPVMAPLEDAARALQFIRSKASEWNIDKQRIGATGGSAGACSSLWLAFHDDMADPKSDDPVARESTRLYCAAVNGAQTSLDPKELREWMPNYGYGAHAFGLPNFQALYDNRDKVLKWIKEYSPIEHVSKDDPPIFMEYPGQKVPPVVGEKQADPTHSAVLGMKLAEKLKAANVEVILVYPGNENPHYKNSAQFLIDRLKK